ncbi:MAG: aldose 1-epimerase [Pseudomonadota bacterium]
MIETPVPNLLGDPHAVRVSAGDTDAIFLPDFGMIGVSLKKDGVEALRRIDNLIVAAAANRTVGIPFLFPFANRLSDFQYEVAGRGVTLPPHSLVLRYDENGLPMHGLMWPHLKWSVEDASESTVSAHLDWSHPQGLAVFPYPCQLTLRATIEPGSLSIETSLKATGDIDVPVSFGFHPYFGLGGDRANWHVRLPKMRHLTLDARQIPTGASEPYPGLDDTLGLRSFDDGFVLLEPQATLSIAYGGRQIAVDLLEGYTHTQVYAPHDQNYIAFEPMTAPANALISGEGLRLVSPGETFTAKFRIRLDEA